MSEIKGWIVDKTKHYYEAESQEFLLETFARLYTAIDRGGGRHYSPEEQERIRRLNALVDSLAVELCGGVPEEFEAFT